jgi:hypothetical protein
MQLTPARPSRAARDAMEDTILLDWARMWIHCGRLGMQDTFRARGILEGQLGVKVPFLRSHVVWLLDNPGRVIPSGYLCVHLDGDKANDDPHNLLFLPRYLASSKAVREWWRMNAQRKRIVYSRD